MDGKMRDLQERITTDSSGGWESIKVEIFSHVINSSSHVDLEPHLLCCRKETNIEFIYMKEKGVWGEIIFLLEGTLSTWNTSNMLKDGLLENGMKFQVEEGAHEEELEILKYLVRHINKDCIQYYK